MNKTEKSEEHGISIGFRRSGDHVYLKIQISGRLEHDDYDLMVPMIENAISGIKKPKIKVLIDAIDFEGWDLRAAWDDLKFGLEHNSEFTELAFVGNKKWEEYSIKISNWFMHAKMRYFEDIEDARQWLKYEEK
ncbi:MAG: STAS/SEC14 domain-containing protein [Campylobacterota bacterium]|nr:STAS/SEC14 domain-containing protein [Campylobacterota bacterium]